jgi:hypothetical protein
MNKSFSTEVPYRPENVTHGSATPEVRSLELDIEVTRDELDRTLDELQAKLSPRRQLRDAVRAARRNGADLGRIAADYSRRHPVPVVLAGALLLTLAGRRMFARRSP